MRGKSMERRFPAEGIHTIKSINVAIYNPRSHDEGDEIVLVVPDSMTYEAHVDDGILVIKGSGGSISGDLNLQVGFLSEGVSGGGVGQMIEIKFPQHRDISLENVYQ